MSPRHKYDRLFSKRTKDRLEIYFLVIQILVLILQTLSFLGLNFSSDLCSMDFKSKRSPWLGYGATVRSPITFFLGEQFPSSLHSKRLEMKPTARLFHSKAFAYDSNGLRRF